MTAPKKTNEKKKYNINITVDYELYKKLNEIENKSKYIRNFIKTIKNLVSKDAIEAYENKMTKEEIEFWESL